MADADVTADVLAALGLGVLEHSGGRRFSLVGRAPEWLARFSDAWRDGGTADAGEAFPAMEAFLIEPEALWRHKGGGGNKVARWTEHDAAGNEYCLEAYTLWVGRRRLMVIGLMDDDFVTALRRNNELRLEIEVLRGRAPDLGGTAPA